MQLGRGPGKRPGKRSRQEERKRAGDKAFERELKKRNVSMDALLAAQAAIAAQAACVVCAARWVSGYPTFDYTSNITLYPSRPAPQVNGLPIPLEP